MDSLYKACGNRFGTRDCGPHNHRVCTQVQGPPHLFRLRNVPFHNQGNPKPFHQAFDQFPIHGSRLCRLRCEAIKRSGHCIRARVLSGQCILKGRDIGQNGLAYLFMNATNQIRPGLRGGEPVRGAIERDDVCTGGGNGSRSGEVWSNRNFAAYLAFLYADNRQVGFLAKGFDAFDAVGSQSSSPAAYRRDGQASKRVYAVKRVAWRRLTGNNQGSAKRCWNHRKLNHPFERVCSANPEDKPSAWSKLSPGLVSPGVCARQGKKELCPVWSIQGLRKSLGTRSVSAEELR